LENQKVISFAEKPAIAMPKLERKTK